MTELILFLGNYFVIYLLCAMGNNQAFLVGYTDFTWKDHFWFIIAAAFFTGLGISMGLLK